MIDLDPEDAILVTLARATRARVGADEGAAVRDESGRTYTAATVALPSLRLSALEAAVAAAVASGSSALSAAAVVTAGSSAPPPVLADLGTERYLVAGVDGAVAAVHRLTKLPPHR